jgi:hypothetical protein
MNENSPEQQTHAEDYDVEVDLRLAKISGSLTSPLRGNDQDLASALLVLAAGVVGGLTGGLAGALVGTLWPETIDVRTRDYLIRTARRLQAQAKRLAHLERRVGDLQAQHMALLEEGAEAAARATSTERIEIIASIVGDGLSADELQAEFERSHLRLLNSLTDRDVSVLRHAGGFGKRGRTENTAPTADLRAQLFSRAVASMSVRHLISAGLLEEAVQIKTGVDFNDQLRSSISKKEPSLTQLGRSLLLRLDEAAKLPSDSEPGPS